MRRSSPYNVTQGAQQVYVYNCFPFRTTVEGAIICFHSINIILEWLEINWEQKKYKEFIDDILIYNENIQVVIIRCIFHGKVDTLETEIKNEQIRKIVNKYSINISYLSYILNQFTIKLLLDISSY